MGKMKDLFGDEVYEAYARSSDPGTSHAAAESLSETYLTKREAIAYQACKSCGRRGMINDELVEITGLEWKSITPRMAPLLKKGKVFHKTDPETGEIMTRRGAAGRQQEVWFAR